MNLQLTPELEEMIQRKVRTGRYNDADEVMREALRLMDESDRVQSAYQDDIREKIEAGLKSLEEGKGVDGEAVFARLEAELDEMERNGRK